MLCKAQFNTNRTSHHWGVYIHDPVICKGIIIPSFFRTKLGTRSSNKRDFFHVPVIFYIIIIASDLLVHIHTVLSVPYGSLYRVLFNFFHLPTPPHKPIEVLIKVNALSRKCLSPRSSPVWKLQTSRDAHLQHSFQTNAMQKASPSERKHSWRKASCTARQINTAQARMFISSNSST